jgi:fatty-acyl-CoA synthase
MSKVRAFVVAAAFVLSLALPIHFAAAALATRFGLIDWRFGFGTLTLGYGPLLLMVAAGLAVAALLLALLIKPRTGFGKAALALVIPVLALGYAGYVRSEAASIPPIHDIVSDADLPLMLSDRVMALRAAVPGVNAVEADPRVPDDDRFGAAAGQSARALQRSAYPDIQPILIAQSTTEAFETALAAARAEGWSIDATDPENGRIEASVRSLWFGFVDDVVVQVSPAEGGSRIDVRSTSRVGVSDLGANAERVRAFQRAFE